MALIDRLQLRTGETDTALLNEIITEATDIYLSCRYPTATDNRPTTVEPQYEGIVLLMAVEIYDRIGAEGQTSHNENGVNRSWSGGGWVSRDLLSQIVPKCGVVE